MHFTNRLNFPKYIVDWLTHDDYDHTTDANTFSATTLLKPIKIHWLTVRYDHELSMDVSDMASSRIGSAVHDSIEKIDTPSVEKEIRLTREIEIDGEKYVVRGKFDILEQQPDGSHTLRDIKTTSVWAYILGGKDEDYCKQMSVYRWLLQDEYENVNNVGYIDFFFTDWQSAKAKIDKNYPKFKVKPGYPVQLMSLEETENFVTTKIKQFVKYRDVPVMSLPACSLKDLWATDEKWAVSKPRATKATKLCNSENEAIQYMADRKIKGSIQYRPPKVKRCRFCAAFPFCQQGQTYANTGMIQY